MTIKRYKEVLLKFASLLSDMIECEHLTHAERFEAVERLVLQIEDAQFHGLSNTPIKGKIGREQLRDDLGMLVKSLRNAIHSNWQKNEKRSNIRWQVEELFNKIDGAGKKVEA